MKDIVVLFTVLKLISGSSEFTFSNFHQEDVQIQQEAIQAVVKRVLPNDFRYFKVEVAPNFTTNAFQVFSSGNGTVFITGSTGVDVASGLNYYLKYYCFCQISWQDQQLSLPKVLPKVDETIAFNDQFRYYQNICTSSYSFVWWDWQQWEKHIDWIALNNFNLVLTPNGQEFIWALLYETLGMTQREIDEHFTGPAFLAWNRMGNLRTWGGPLPTGWWHKWSYFLQKKILLRLRSLGIIPVLPGFAGHVPRAFKRLYPNASLTKITCWSKFNDSYCCPYFLDPEDSLFESIGEKYYKLLNQYYGASQTNNMVTIIYSVDNFNEMSPLSDNLTYLRNVGKAVYATMQKSNPEAIWLMQSWMLYFDPFWTKDRAEAFITSVPKGKMIILDLQSEQFPQYDLFDSYFGQPYIWCMLHNFGGTLGIYGSADIINTEPFRARNTTTMIGTGLTPEGINQNYVIYDLMTEMSWRKEPVDLTKWFANYAKRRYGVNDASANETWQILKATVYNFKGKERIRGKYSINTRPSLRLRKWDWYEKRDLYRAFVIFLDASDALGDSLTYKHDLVDLTRQVLQELGDEYHKKISTSFKNKNLFEFIFLKNDTLEIFDDLQLILASNENFLLGKWLNDSKSIVKKNSNNTKESALFEYNARNQITLWGPNGEIFDYANKQWAGIASDYFKPRWEIFLNTLQECLITGNEFNETQTFEKMFTEVEEPFTFSNSSYPTKAKGDSVAIARFIRDKWTLKGMLEFDMKHIYRLQTSGSLTPSTLRQEDIDVIMLQK